MKPCYRRACMIFDILLPISLASLSNATEIHQWQGPDGQVHYGDRAPSGTVVTRTLRLQEETATSSSGLRPAELQGIERIKRHEQQQRKRTKSAQRAYRKKQAQTHKQCQQARDNFRNARKDEDFSQHALYLRKHCR